MRTYKMKTTVAGFVLIGLLTAGCLLSGTFVVKKDIHFDFTAGDVLYFYGVDITEEPDWKDHKDDIQFIDAVGVEFFIRNTGQVTDTFNVWIDEFSDPASTPTSVPGTASKIINNFVVPPGTTHITYDQSLKILTGLDRLKQLAFKGMFDYYATSTGSSIGSTFFVDSGVVWVTVSAGS
jgi:hypothetical protein